MSESPRPATTMRQHYSVGISTDPSSQEPESVISFSNGTLVDLQPRMSSSNATRRSRISSSVEDTFAIPQHDEDVDDKAMMTKATGWLASKVPDRLKFLTRASSSLLSDSSEAMALSPPPPCLDDSPKPLPPVRRLSSSTGRRMSSIGSDAPVSPGFGRARNFTVEQITRRCSVITARIMPEHEIRGARRNSVRLSEADVGFLLGKVNRIGPETLRQAARDGNAQLCEALVRGGVDVNAKEDEGGQFPLLIAVEHGKSDCAHHLLDLGAEVDLPDVKGRTALAVAVELGKLSCIQVLVSAGADGNLLTPSIFTRCLRELEQALVEENEPKFVLQSEVCRILLQSPQKRELFLHRELFQPRVLFLVDEWNRASKAGEELVMPPLARVIEGETHLLRFLKQHRRRVSILTVIKIWFVVMFIVFDLVTRDMQMTPQRLLTYAFLYVGAYYT
ncbi:hypothetical protein BASA81_001908 [Batrachochytrium salamandrivorans]|nr:hypothetical protein BASA81_001908 [Batrachochytrium salamandrivorans]